MNEFNSINNIARVSNVCMWGIFQKWHQDFTFFFLLVMRLVECDRKWMNVWLTGSGKEADTISHWQRYRVGLAIADSNYPTIFQAREVYCLLLATHSNLNWANFVPNERTAGWAMCLALCPCTWCLAYTEAFFSLSMGRYLLEQPQQRRQLLRPPRPHSMNTFAYFRRLIMSWLFRNPSKYFVNHSIQRSHCTFGLFVFYYYLRVTCQIEKKRYIRIKRYA